ncbi:putative inner membrane protein [mine drainage metagenome]|uniref:Putative inner membrane protein n=1 Tax=mine drainage metagenome TaxID=410659 RepID=A0A1J5SGV6_9ZZZZ
MDASVLVKTIVWWGLGLGTVFGFIANKTNFCTMGAVSDVVNMGHWGRMRAWLLAIAVAMIGTNLLVYLGYLDLSKTIYTGNSFPWLAYIAGGLCFGVGMTLASGCGNKTLVRIGGGNLRSVVVFIFMGFAALVTLRGILGAFRVKFLLAPAVSIQLDHGQTLSAFLSGIGGLSPETLQLAIACVIGLAILIFVFKDKKSRQSTDNNLAGLIIGLIVVGGWFVTGHLGFGENPDTLEMTYLGTNSHLAESMSFIAPTAYTLEYWAYWTDISTIVTFGVATIFGVGIGSFLYAMITKSFRWEAFSSPQDMFYHIIGATLMGFGGVTAMGCTIGQGITGVSTLSLGSFLALISIVIGSSITMKIQYAIISREN